MGIATAETRVTIALAKTTLARDNTNPEATKTRASSEDTTTKYSEMDRVGFSSIILPFRQQG